MKSCATLLCLALAATAVHARDSKFGFQLTATKPQAELGTLFAYNIAPGLGLHSLMDYGYGHAAVPRFDYAQYSRDETGLEVDLYETRFGVDYNYYFSKEAGEGLYFSAGVGLAYGRLDVKSSQIRGEDSAAGLYVTGGLGWMVTPHVGLEAKYTAMRYGFAMATGSGGTVIATDGELTEAPSFSLSLMVRF